MEMKDDGVRALNLKIGLKLWSKNIEVLSQAREMHERSVFDYIELYIVPDTMQAYGSLWRDLEIDMIVHAPHFGHGFNLADAGLARHNSEIFTEVARFADILNADIIIVHGGNGGAKRETICQLKTLKDSRLLIENKPKLGLNGRECIGYLPGDIAEIVSECGLSGFVLDFNHAVCAARSLCKDPLEFIREFLTQKPRMFHLGDGDYSSLIDTHKHLGHGDMPLDEFITFLPENAIVTVETPNDFSKGLRDFDENRIYFNHLLDRRRNRTN